MIISWTTIRRSNPSRFCTAPIVPKVNSIRSPVSRANFGAKSVTTYFTAPADRTLRCVAADMMQSLDDDS